MATIAPIAKTTTPTILSYASPTKTALSRYVAVGAAVVAVGSAALIVATTFRTRYALESYFSTGWCGTPRASLELQLYTLPASLFVPCVVAAAVADHFRCAVAACRVSVCIAILGWAACAFLG
jgi:hypothetical protein